MKVLFFVLLALAVYCSLMVWISHEDQAAPKPSTVIDCKITPRACETPGP